jgi:hypothetical protein
MEEYEYHFSNVAIQGMVNYRLNQLTMKENVESAYQLNE